MQQFSNYFRNATRRIGSIYSEGAGHRFQYMSDLHLEVGQQYLDFEFEATAPTLVLGGDIGRLVDYDGYLGFLQRQTCRYQRVFLVLGNHEFYGLSFETGLDTARKLEGEAVLSGNLTLLQKNSFSFDDGSGVVVLGCPLWSHIPQESASTVASVVNDFNKIQEWSVEKHNTAHAGDLEWLKQKVVEIQAREAKAKILIVTHHAPLIDKTASPQHKDSPINSAFATDVCNTGDIWSPVRYWIFGHTHWTTQLKSNGIHVVSNQRGYVFPGNTRLIVGKQPPKHTFDPTKTIQL